MLRNRSRAVTKQTPIMSDHQPTTQNPTRPISSSSPRFFNGGFLIKHFSPTLATKKEILKFASDPFRFTKNPEKPLKDFKKFQQNFNFDSEGITLVLDQENGVFDICSKSTNNRKVLLKIQIPSGDRLESRSPGSLGDYGIKTKNANISGDPTPTGFGSRKYSTGPLSMREMESSEEYTCVIKNGPNPKTTHIYDNFVVASCCGIRVGSPPPPPPMMVESVVGFCVTCKKKLAEGCDIFMYRGEKAFCSVECRCQEMILDGLINT